MTAPLMQSVFSSHPEIVDLALEVAMKATILCLVVWGAHFVAGRNRLLLRSALWQVCLLGLVVLPAAVVAIPRCEVATQFAAGETWAIGRTSSLSHLHQDANGFDSVDTMKAGNTQSAVSPSELGAAVTATETAARPQVGNASRMVVLAVAAAYLLILAILLVRLAVSLMAVVSLRRRSNPVVNPAWLHALGRWIAELRVPMVVELQQTDVVSVPVIVGWRRPTIILPAGMAQTADGTTIDAVLLHELTHLMRGDYVWNILLRLVLAVYWPHPGAWLVGRMVRCIREDICDAVCVHWMGDARRYCGVLADVAVGLRRRPEAALGIAMTRSSHLSRRLSRIEHTPGTDRCLLAWQARTVIAAIVVVAAGALGSLRFVAHATAADADPSRKAEHAAEESEPGIESSEQKASESVEVERQRVDPANPPSKNQNAPDASKGKSKPSRMKAAKVQRGTLQITTTQPASLEPFGEISIHSRNSGVVSKVTVNVGDRVQAGEVLAELDALDISSEIAEKEASLALAEADEERAKVAVDAAKATVQSLAAKLAKSEVDAEKAISYEKFRRIQYERVKQLFEMKSIDERLLDEKEEQLRAAESEIRSTTAKIATAKAARISGEVDVRLAESSLKPAALRVASVRADLKRTQSKTKDDFRLIRSPIDGVVLEKNIDLDVNVKSGDSKPLFRLAGTGLITAVVLLPERDGLRVKRNNAATLEIDALNKAGPIAGKVSRIAYSFDRATRTLRTEISLPNADGKLKPGMFGRATVVIEEIPDVLWVPASAIGEVDGKGMTATCVQIVNGRAVRTPVELGRDNGQQFEIIKGLAEGDVVVDFQKSPADGEPLLDPILLPELPKGTERPILLPGEPSSTRVVDLPRNDIRSAVPHAAPGR